MHACTVCSSMICSRAHTKSTKNTVVSRDTIVSAYEYFGLRTESRRNICYTKSKKKSTKHQVQNKKFT